MPRDGRNGTEAPGSIVLSDALPPQNLEAEQGVLGSVLLDPSLVMDVLVELSSDDFYRDAHRIAFESIARLTAQGQPVDIVTVCEDLSARGLLEKIGGDDVLAAAIQSVPHAANAVYYARIVRQKSIQRQIVALSDQFAREGRSNLYTSDELFSRLESELYRIGGSHRANRLADAVEFAKAGFEQIASWLEGGMPGIATGHASIDGLIDGLKPGNLYVMAARPSMGKTALALDIAGRLAVHDKIPVLVVSLEMSKADLSTRMILAMAEVSQYRIKGRALNQAEYERLALAYGQLSEASIFLEDTASLDMPKIASIVRRATHRHKIRVVFVDYLQLIPGSRDDGDSRQEQVASFSKRLKGLARDLDLSVVALSQLNREPEKRKGNRPMMGDLRESGAIEQDADVVMLMHRPDYYDPNESPGLCEVIVAKNRNGMTGTARLLFQRDPLVFREYGGAIDAGPDF
jgi:replicative DNA helicase